MYTTKFVVYANIYLVQRLFREGARIGVFLGRARLLRVFQKIHSDKWFWIRWPTTHSVTEVPEWFKRTFLLILAHNFLSVYLYLNSLTYTQLCHCTRATINNIMRTEDLDGSQHCDLSSKCIHWTPLVSLGPNHEWSPNGYDKLSTIGFPIWSVCNKYSGQWLKA